MRDDDVSPMPAPWRVDQIPGGYIVKDANGRSLAYCYAGSPEARSANHALLSWEEARRLAVNIAKLPELLGRTLGAAGGEGGESEGGRYGK